MNLKDLSSSPTKWLVLVSFLLLQAVERTDYEIINHRLTIFKLQELAIYSQKVFSVDHQSVTSSTDRFGRLPFGQTPFDHFSN